MRRVIIVIVSSITLITLANSQILGLDEGATCRNDLNLVWQCKKVSDCPQIDVRRTRPNICSFQGREAIICCPGATTSGGEKTSRAQEMCTRYMQSTCFNTARSKRNINAESNNSATDMENEDEMAPRIFGLGNVITNIFGTTKKPTVTTTAIPVISNDVDDTVISVDDVGVQNEDLNEQTDNDDDEDVGGVAIDDSDRRVIGGRMSRARQHPHMALVGYGQRSNIQWNCGASLISNRFVLSAAHCSKNNIGPALWVRLGELDLESTNDDARPEDYTITQQFVHPEYVEPAVYNDIALFKLHKDVIFTAWVRPSCLYTLANLNVPWATATGWGRTDFVGDTSSALMEADISIVNGTECKRLFGISAGRRLPRGIDTNRMICAGEPDGSKDTCSGDSGGPFVIREAGKCLKTQIGVTSFGRQCALPNSPAVYTRVSFYISWIERIVWP